MTEAAVGLGANLGDKVEQIEKAMTLIGELNHTGIKASSRLYRTEPVGKTDQDWFVNAAVLLETELDPVVLLMSLLGIENRLGRIRTEKWGPRRIDLDLLFYGQIIMDSDDLKLPHPFLKERRFVLAPLADVAPHWKHPVSRLAVLEMAAALESQGQEVTVI